MAKQTVKKYTILKTFKNGTKGYYYSKGETSKGKILFGWTTDDDTQDAQVFTDIEEVNKIIEVVKARNPEANVKAVSA